MACKTYIDVAHPSLQPLLISHYPVIFVFHALAFITLLCHKMFFSATGSLRMLYLTLKGLLPLSLSYVNVSSCLSFGATTVGSLFINPKD